MSLFLDLLVAEAGEDRAANLFPRKLRILRDPIRSGCVQNVFN
jgi:hypothetical protein